MLKDKYTFQEINEFQKKPLNEKIKLSVEVLMHKSHPVGSTHPTASKPQQKV